jgi:hypothetical protein
MSLDDYARRLSSEPPFRIHPVVQVAAGAEVELRVDRKAIDDIPGGIDGILFEGLEPVGEVMAHIRLKARKNVYLDLEHLIFSTDTSSWIPLEWSFFPWFRASELTVKPQGGGPAVAVPVQPDFNGVRLEKDPFAPSTLK